MSTDLIHELQNKIDKQTAKIRDLENKLANKGNDKNNSDPLQADKSISTVKPRDEGNAPELIVDLNNQLSKLKLLSTKQKDQIAQQESELKKRAEELIALKKTSETQLTQQKSSYEQQLIELKTKSEVEITSARVALDQQLDSKMKALQQEYEKQKKALQITLEEKSGKITSLQTIIDDLKKQLSSVTSNLNKQNMVMHYKAKSDSETEDKILQLECDLSDKKSELINKDREILALSTKIADLSKQLLAFQMQNPPVKK